VFVFLFLLKRSSLGCLVFPLLQEAPLVQPFGFHRMNPKELIHNLFAYVGEDTLDLVYVQHGNHEKENVVGVAYCS